MKEEKDLVPLFLTKDASGNVYGAGAILSSEEEGETKKFRASTFIDTVTDDIKDEIRELLEKDNMAAAGEFTVYAYLVLETLNKCGFTSLADLIQQDPRMIEQAAMLCAIGFKAGLETPREVSIETTKIDSSNIWKGE